MRKQPKPFDIEKTRAKCVSRQPEPFDSILPSPGFLTDFVLGLYNSESPVLYTLWSGIWAVAMAIKREAWIKWFEDDPLFGNFYIILSGPPSNKKGKAIGRAVRVYNTAIGPIGKHGKGSERPKYSGKLTEPWAIVTKSHVPILMDASTTRPLKDVLSYKDRKYYGHEFGLEFPLAFKDGSPWLDSSGNQVIYTKTSEIGIVAEELSTFLGRQKYNEGLVQLLLALYSTDLEREDRTAMYGVIKMRGLCTNLLAGTTPKSFQQAVADTAKGDGFLSRTVIAHSSHRYQRFFPPPDWSFLPSVDDLSERLAFIAENTVGEHVLDEEASKLAKAWYAELGKKIQARPDKEFFLSRADVNMLKLSLIIKAQRYTKLFDNTISAQDVSEAIRIIEMTLATTPGIWSGQPAYRKLKQRLYEAIALSKKPLSYQSLRLRFRISSSQLDTVLTELIQHEKIAVVDERKQIDPRLKGFATFAEDEKYIDIARDELEPGAEEMFDEDEEEELEESNKESHIEDFSR